VALSVVPDLLCPGESRFGLMAGPATAACPGRLPRLLDTEEEPWQCVRACDPPALPRHPVAREPTPSTSRRKRCARHPHGAAPRRTRCLPGLCHDIRRLAVEPRSRGLRHVPVVRRRRQPGARISTSFRAAVARSLVPAHEIRATW